MNHSISALAAACAACTMTIAAQAQDVGALLKAADRFRLSTAGPSQGAKAPTGGSEQGERGGVVAAGPSQGAKAPTGGSEQGERGGVVAAGPSQGAKAPTGGSEQGERGGMVSADNLQVDTQVQLFNADGTLNKERRYTVFVQAGRQSLVLMQSPAEKGQKVLMLGDDFWLLMPGSQRPLRITPMQKLLGDASTGDIATLSWSGDYTATLVGEEACTAASDVDTLAEQKNQSKNASNAYINSLSCYHLSLQASRKGVTYQRIELWLGKQHHQPVRADLYVQSDKLAKQARFVMDSAAAPTTVKAMVLVDQLNNQKETRVTYLHRTARKVPAEWLNPMFLARNPSLE